LGGFCLTGVAVPVAELDLIGEGGSMNPQETQGETESRVETEPETPPQVEQGQEYRDYVIKFDQQFEALLEAYAHDPERWDGLE
jgi:hypothetical protein